MSRYNYFTNHENLVVCTSKSRGVTLRGEAHCSPEDNFSLQTGKRWARARCELKVAKSNIRDLKTMCDVYQGAIQEMTRYMERYSAKLNSAVEAKERALKVLDDLRNGGVNDVF